MKFTEQDFKDEKVENSQENKEACCKQSPRFAFMYAIVVDPTPDDMVRKVVSEDPIDAFHYAIHIDKGPHEVTRTGACSRPYTAYLYAVYIDQKPTDETRQAVYSRTDVPNVIEHWEKWEKTLDK